MTETAKADIRALDKPTAMPILSALHRFAESGTGDVKALQGEQEELRLRIGDYRLFFVCPAGCVIEIRRVLHRKETLPLRQPASVHEIARRTPQRLQRICARRF